MVIGDAHPKMPGGYRAEEGLLVSRRVDNKSLAGLSSLRFLMRSREEPLKLKF